jgi:hypothetical protein
MGKGQVYGRFSRFLKRELMGKGQVYGRFSEISQNPVLEGLLILKFGMGC